MGRYKTLVDLSNLAHDAKAIFAADEDSKSNASQPFEDELLVLDEKFDHGNMNAKAGLAIDHTNRNIDDEIVWAEDKSGPAVTVGEIKKTLAFAKAILSSTMPELNDMKEMGNLPYVAEEE